MASSPKPNNGFHIRSITLPCRSHPNMLRLVEELSKVRAWEARSAPTAETVCNGLGRLEEVYKCVVELYNLPLTQEVLSQCQNEKWVDDLLDVSLRTLDICGIARDVMSQTMEHVRDLQSSLRRRKGEPSIESSINKYTHFRKKMEKEARKLMAAVKRIDTKIEASPLQHLDHRAFSVIRVLREVGVMSGGVFQSLLLFLSIPILKPKPTKWSLVSKLLHKGAVACEDQQSSVNELESADIALHSLCRSCSIEGDKLQIAQSRLDAVEACIELVENGLGSMFRQLVKTRASFLNTLSII